MSGNTWFAVENNIVDRSDLTIHEKMCCVVLARYAGRQEFSQMLNTQVVAIRMGCSHEEAEKAIHSLMGKGLISIESTERIEPENIFAGTKAPEPPSNIVKPSTQAQIKETAKPASWLTLELDDGDDEAIESTEITEPVKMDEPENHFENNVLKESEKIKKVDKNFDEEELPKKKSEKKAEEPRRPTIPKAIKDEMAGLVEQVYEIIDENINDREARIILSFANNDIERIREKYRIAKKAQVNDKIEVLINELQKKESPAPSRRPVSTGDEKNQNEQTPGAPQVNQQINLNQINSMAAYKQSAYGKKTK